jgi:hypothetical protein
MRKSRLMLHDAVQLNLNPLNMSYFNSFILRNPSQLLENSYIIDLVTELYKNIS